MLAILQASALLAAQAFALAVHDVDPTLSPSADEIQVRADGFADFDCLLIGERTISGAVTDNDGYSASVDITDVDEVRTKESRSTFLYDDVARKYELMRRTS